MLLADLTDAGACQGPRALAECERHDLPAFRTTAANLATALGIRG
ncbi:hypothetical protein JOF56_011028 [Kibdelosporangium banguiense]|uniref:Uncharacterized protein n=1 Tax=Kibdelosporangium banguiense TaxID=1365924 RepID=A0ABS4U1V1_9PSEU|nr:hypothetical protein [Kibdelosporangium banguiense]MBP2330643.1 hypothetical protein [Kibdelosporangium banguiense]